MRRSRNGMLWTGFGGALLAAFSYPFLFIGYPATRDFPWVNLLLFVAAGCLLAGGIYRAYARPERYRGRFAGPPLAVLSLALLALFCWGLFYEARRIPSGGTALRVGQPAPDFTLAAADGSTVTLSALRSRHRAVLLIFYRGYW